MCGSVEEKAFTANNQLLRVVEGERVFIRKRHAWQLLEEQDRVLRSYYAQREGQGSQRKSGRKRSILIKWKENNEIGFTKAVAGGQQPRDGTR